MIETVLLTSSLTVATIFDIKTKKIPNFYNVFLLILGISFSMTIKDMTIVKSLLWLSLYFTLSYPLYYFKALGAGDVKLLIAISSFLSLNNWLMLISISLVMAAIIYSIKLAIINEFDFEHFHFYRYTHFILWAYFILLFFLKIRS